MLNVISLVGRFTADPELKKTPSGLSVTSFSLAVERNSKQNGEKATDFINCVAWRNTADFICKYFSKADFIAVSGELQTRKYQDRDGNNRTATEVIINQASFCGSNARVQTDDNNSKSKGNIDVSVDDNDLPF